MVGHQDLQLYASEYQVSYCAILVCFGTKDKDCGRKPIQARDLESEGITFNYIRLSAEFGSEETVLVMPATLDFSLLPMDSDVFNFEEHIDIESG